MKGELWLGSLGLRTLGRDCVSRVVVVGRALSPPKNGSLLRDSAFWAFIWVCCLQKEGRGRWRWQDEASPFQARQLLTGARPLTVASPSIYLPLKDPFSSLILPASSQNCSYKKTGAFILFTTISLTLSSTWHIEKAQ